MHTGTPTGHSDKMKEHFLPCARRWAGVNGSVHFSEYADDGEEGILIYFGGSFTFNAYCKVTVIRGSDDLDVTWTRAFRHRSVSLPSVIVNAFAPCEIVKKVLNDGLADTRNLKDPDADCRYSFRAYVRHIQPGQPTGLRQSGMDRLMVRPRLGALQDVINIAVADGDFVVRALAISCLAEYMIAGVGDPAKIKYVLKRIASTPGDSLAKLASKQLDRVDSAEITWKAKLNRIWLRLLNT